MLIIYHRSVKEPLLTTLPRPKAGSWIHAENPTDEERKFLVEELGFDEGIIADACDPFEVPRFEIEDGIPYFVTRFPVESEGEVTTSPFLIAVGPNVTLTVALRKAPFLQRFIDSKIDFYTTQKTKLALLFISTIQRQYQRHLTAISRTVRKNRVHLREIRNRDIETFVSLETTLNDFIATLVPTNAALQELLAGSVLPMFEDDRELVEDLERNTVQFAELSKANLKTIQNIRSAYSTTITNSLNVSIRFLTALTIIFTIPTTIASFFGMNVPVPFGGHPFAFSMIVLATALLMAGVWYAFARKRWV